MYHFSVLALWLLPGLISSVAESDIEESFAEELYLKPLTDGKVLAYAQFTTLSGRYVLALITCVKKILVEKLVLFHFEEKIKSQ